MSIRETTTNEQKVALRKIKSGRLADLARNALNKGITSNGMSGAYIQFGSDLTLYGLWEALLYAESYESQGEYAPGTVSRAIELVIAKLPKSKV